MTNETEPPDGYYYARGTFRRLAEEEYHQPRQRNLRDYWNRPSGQEVVDAMVEKGWSEDVAEEAVKRLWMDQRRAAEERGENA